MLKLIAFGSEFDELAAQIDKAIVRRTDVGQEILDRFDCVELEILMTEARTIDGLRVKARAACWALLGDLDPASESTTDKRMALSIVRDLIRLYDPGLEQPNALKKLLSEIESGAGNSLSHKTAGLIFL